MASVRRVSILDRDIPLHGQSWEEMEEIDMNQGLWNICIEDNDRVKGKEGLVIMSGREAGQEDFWKETTAHTMQCSLSNSEVGDSVKLNGCWEFLTALLRLPESSEWSHSVELLLSSALTGFLRNQPAGLDLNVGFDDYSFIHCISYQPRKPFFSISYVLLTTRL